MELRVAGGAAAGGAAAGLFSLAALKSGIIPLLTGFLLGSLLVGGGIYMMMDSSKENSAVIATLPTEQHKTNGVTNPDDAEALLSQLGNKHRSGVASETKERNSTSYITETRRTRTEREKGVRQEAQVQSSVNSNFDGTTVAASDVSEKIEHDAAKTMVDLSDMKTKVRADNQKVEPRTRSLEASSDLLPLKSDSDPTMNRSPLPVVPAEKIKVIEDEAAMPDQSIAVEFRKGVVSEHFADNNARKIQTQFFNDMFKEDFAVGAYYSPDAKWQFGIEGGSERYTQSLFYNQNDSVFIEQRPNITWLGLAVGHQVEVLEMPILLQGTLGASTDLGGPLIRGRVGTDLLNLMNTSVPFSVPLSLDISSLVYTYNGQYLVTGNWGLNLGIRYNLGF